MNTTTDTFSILHNYLDALWRKRYLIGIIMLIMPVLGLVAGLLIPKRYEATTSLATFKTAPPSMKELVYVPDINEQFAGISAYLTSTATLQKVLLQAGITTVDTDDKKSEGLAQELAKNLTITLVDKTVVSIKLTGSNQTQMLAILKALSNVVITEFLNPLNASVQQAEGFLNQQVKSQQKKLKDSIEQLSDFEGKNSKFLPKYGKIYTTRLGEIINDLGASETQYNAMLAEKKWLENTLSNVNPAMVSLEKAIAENDLKLNQMRAVYTDNYPGIKSSLELAKTLREEKEKIQSQTPVVSETKVQKLLNTELYTPEKLSIDDKSSTGLSTKIQDYQVLEQKINGLAGKIDDLKKQQNEMSQTLSKVDSTEKTLSILMRAVNENQEIYQDLLKRYDMTRMTLQLTHFDNFSPIKIVSSPQGPLTNMARPVILYIFLGIIGGIFLSLGLALTLDFLDNTVRRKQSIEALTDLLVISRIEKIELI